MLAGEPGRGLSAGGVLGHLLFQFPVQAGGFELGQRLVQHVVVLLAQQLPETIRQALADPDADGAPAEFLDRTVTLRAVYSKCIVFHR